MDTLIRSRNHFAAHGKVTALYQAWSRLVEVLLQWADEFDDLLGAARQHLARFRDRIAGRWG
jgi:hypothetical protein